MGSPADYDLQAHQLMDGGSVDVVLGGPDGPGGPGGPGSAYQYFTQNSPGVPGASFLGDRFGGAIAVGDINGDGYADATISAPGNDIDAATDAGTGWVMQGTTTGLTTRGSHTVGQNSPRVPGTPEKGDRFGGALSLIDTNRDGKAELIASAPGEDTNDGAVWVFPAIADDLPTGGSWFFGGTTLHAPPPTPVSARPSPP
ncbi:FG-GAP repeat protein [Streptomyces sp. HC307]|uniref:FG-GAP repeat protein n=1 Tax=Streptomyces flavusporus TaxID=3385496 RepID=UPI0039170E7E